jgi:hypothetical protein
MRQGKTSRGSVWILMASCAMGLLLCFPPRGLFAQTITGCAASPSVQAALDALPQYRENPALTDWQVYQKRLALLEALLRRYPNSVFVQKEYIGSTTFLRQVDPTSLEEQRKVNTEYKERHEQNPENAQTDYLYGLTLVGRHTPAAIKLFDAALAQDPSFVLPHLELVAIYTSPAFLDKQKSAAHLKAFLNACPDSLAGYERLDWVGDKSLETEYAGKFRNLLERRSDARAIDDYQTLWSLEFKEKPPTQYGPVRQQVVRDLVHLRALKFDSKREWYETLKTGYKLTNSRSQADWAKAQLEKRFPYSGETPEMTKWFKDHQLAPDASSAGKHTYYRALLAQSSQWLKEPSHGVLCTFFIWCDRLTALEHLENAPATEVENAVNEMLKFAAENGGNTPWSGDYSFAAEVLARKHLEPQRLLEFAQKGLAISEIESKAPIPDLYFTKEEVANNKFYNASAPNDFLRFEAEAYLELRQAPQAELTLQQLDERLQNLKSLADSKQGLHRSYLGEESAYWGLMARLAELQGHPEDAMGYYESALLDRFQA